jgi:hypothetical protein
MSCGSRKVQFEKVIIKKDSVVEITSTVSKLDTSIKKDSTNINLDITEDEITFTPIDTTKEIVIDGKKYKNVVLKIKKTKDNSIYKNNNTLSETKRVDSTGTTNIKETSDTNVKNKATEKTTSITWLLWLVLLLTLVYTLWRNKFWPFKK